MKIAKIHKHRVPTAFAQPGEVAWRHRIHTKHFEAHFSRWVGSKARDTDRQEHYALYLTEKDLLLAIKSMSSGSLLERLSPEEAMQFLKLAERAFNPQTVEQSATG